MSMVKIFRHRCDRCGFEHEMLHDSAPPEGWETLTIGVLCDKCVNALESFMKNRSIAPTANRPASRINMGLEEFVHEDETAA